MEVVCEQLENIQFIYSTEIINTWKTKQKKSNYCISNRVMTMLDRRITNLTASFLNQKLDSGDYDYIWKMREK